MKTLLLATIITTTILTASARIGDTREQCESRYGEPDTPIEDELYGEMERFTMDGYRVMCAYDEDGICRVLYVSRLDGEPVSDAETRAIAKSQGTNWRESEGSDYFVSEENVILIAASSSNGSIMFTDDAYAGRRIQEMEEEQSSQASGF